MIDAHKLVDWVQRAQAAFAAGDMEQAKQLLQFYGQAP